MAQVFNETLESAFMRLYLLRHGETDFNRNRIMQGYQDVPINDLGIRQAALAGEHLKPEGINRIVCSDLRRAVMTGCIVAAHTGAPMEYDPALRERNPGRLVGQSYDLEPRFFTDPAYVPPEGESIPVFHDRVRSAFETLVASGRDAGERVAVVTHGMVCHAFVAQFFGDEHVEGVGSPNAGLTIAEYDGGAWRLVRRDCAAHLGALALPAPALAGA